MPIIKNILRQGRTTYQGLKDFDVLVDDEFSFAEGAAISKYFRITNFPAPVPAGNSFFSIQGSEFLKNNVELKTEILDVNETPIFHFPVFNKTSFNSVNISIEVVPKRVDSGVGIITILGELDPEKVSFAIPPEFQNTYNVRVTGLIDIDIDIPNTRPILFYKPPKINVSEIVRNNLSGSTDDTSSIFSITGSGAFFGGSLSGQQAPGTQAPDDDNDQPDLT